MRILLLALAFLASFANAQINKFEFEATRAKLLGFIEKPRATQTEFVGSTDDPKKKEFIKYYKEAIEPRLIAYDFLAAKYRAYMLLIDMAAFASDQEKDQWIAEFAKVKEEANHWETDEEWTAALAKWAQLAEGLTGDLPDEARRANRNRQLEVIPAALKPTLDRISNLELEWDKAKREAPANSNITEYDTEYIKTIIAFKNGELTFQDAQSKIHELFSKWGPHFVAYEAAQSKGDALNRMAVLRTQIAQGRQPRHRTWAEYVLESNGQGYTPEYRGPAAQREFLKKLIAALRPLVDSFYESRQADLHLEGVQLTEQDINLLTLPHVSQLSPYFPKEKVTDLWQETILESGYLPSTLNQILLDDSERPAKDINSAYQMRFFSPYTEIQKVDSDTLSNLPEPKGSSLYLPGFTAIMQTWTAGGVNDLRTAFHEGGHALEAMLRYQIRGADISYGTMEVPSMTNERFLWDPLFLWNKATPVNGERPSLEKTEELAANFRKNQIVVMMDIATSALFDIELWDYDYTAPGAETFLQRVETVRDEVKGLSGGLPSLESKVPDYYSRLSTSHFTSGEVRYIGYVFAEMASRMTAQYVTDELEKVSGRRTWWKQPLLGKIFTEQVFEQLWRDPFPVNIEKITGRKFDPAAIVEDLKRELEGGTSCVKNLTAQKPKR